jgi:prephenate dehydratase
VVPVENSIEGRVGPTLDSLWRYEDLQVYRALELPISHALISWNRDPTAITKVYSHPQALAQCQGWLENHLPQASLIPLASTTEALAMLATEPQHGAIASLRAADIYQVPILAQGIQDYPDNRTRFWMVGRAGTPPLTVLPLAEESRLSLAFSPQRRGPGVLVEALQIFAREAINLSRIESRPSKKILGEYIFFLDALGDNIAPALAELTPLTERLRILGSYGIQRLN